MTLIKIYVKTNIITAPAKTHPMLSQTEFVHSSNDTPKIDITVDMTPTAVIDIYKLSRNCFDNLLYTAYSFFI